MISVRLWVKIHLHPDWLLLECCRLCVCAKYCGRPLQNLHHDVCGMAVVSLKCAADLRRQGVSQNGLSLVVYPMNNVQSGLRTTGMVFLGGLSSVVYRKWTMFKVDVELQGWCFWMVFRQYFTLYMNSVQSGLRSTGMVFLDDLSSVVYPLWTMFKVDVELQGWCFWMVFCQYFTLYMNSVQSGLRSTGMVSLDGLSSVVYPMWTMFKVDLELQGWCFWIVFHQYFTLYMNSVRSGLRITGMVSHDGLSSEVYPMNEHCSKWT